MPLFIGCPDNRPPPSKAAGRGQVFNVFSGAFAPVPQGHLSPNNHGALPSPHFSRLPPFSSPLFPFYASHSIPSWAKRPLLTHLTAIIIWIFVYRKIHTYVLYEIHIDNIVLVLPLVTWMQPVQGTGEQKSPSGV